ncbi:hypothetical protein ERJ75_001153200 [Trypanosoma vivax]|nr:hypothetical protein ERJ75_001153200 [Trypanosoma vivax]
MCLAGAEARVDSGTRWFGAHARASQKRYISKAEANGRHGSADTPRAAIAPVPMLPNEVRASTVPRNAPPGKAQPAETAKQAQLAEGRVPGLCGATPAAPKLVRANGEARTENPEGRGVVLQGSTASFLKELFKLESPNANTPDEQELRPARA